MGYPQMTIIEWIIKESQRRDFHLHQPQKSSGNHPKTALLDGASLARPLGCKQIQNAVGAVTGRGLAPGISLSAGCWALGSPHPQPGTPTFSGAHFYLLEIKHTQGRLHCWVLGINSIRAASSLVHVKSNWTLKALPFCKEKENSEETVVVLFLPKRAIWKHLKLGEAETGHSQKQKD